MNITPVFEILLTPSVINVDNSPPKPPMTAVIIGTTIKAITGDVFLVITRTNNITIVKNPKPANINKSSLKYLPVYYATNVPTFFWANSDVQDIKF